MSDKIRDRDLSESHQNNQVFPVISSPKSMFQGGESSAMESKLGESSKRPLVECDGGIDEGAGSKRKQSIRARSSERHLSCERVLSTGGAHIAYRVPSMPAYDYNSMQPTVSAPGRLEEIGMDPGMAIQAGFSPLSLVMASPASIPWLHSTSTYPIPGESSSHHPIPDITQHGVWAPSTLLKPTPGPVGIGHGLIENYVPFPGLSNLRSLPLPSIFGLSPTFGPGIQSQLTPSMPQPFNYLQVMASSTTSSSIAPSTIPRLSASRHYPEGESSYQVVPRIGQDTNQAPPVQDPFAMIQCLQRSSSLSSSPLEMMAPRLINMLVYGMLKMLIDWLLNLASKDVVFETTLSNPTDENVDGRCDIENDQAATELLF
ncbi:hypothetical protein BUALT_Bualt17G0102000 [Buddleja alternifolia]|uniref:Uncharacterized protein n=1 Tax=Buddleja alternifolia TaxID=168488 RepID=A0AAV6WIA7_9LAMI|nr:hypothetical protein BUALT_Bualt17G0102000 [Buddleja alternifolia]